MKHPQPKAWTMKHPALARVFAVVLAVMSIILLAAGISGIGENNDENEERLRYEKKYAERIANYTELDAQLANSISYEEAYAELEKILEQHEDDASQHRTDLALYSAEKGGNTMGANVLWEVMPELKGARIELEQGKAELAEQEEQLNLVLENEQLIRMAASLISSGKAGTQELIRMLEEAIRTLEQAEKPVPKPIPTPGPETEEEVVVPPEEEAVIPPEGETPEDTVEPSPEAGVEPTPAPSTEPSPEPTVEPAPEVSAEPSPEATVEPTPEVSVEPEELTAEESPAVDLSAVRAAGSSPAYAKLRTSPVMRSPSAALELPENVVIPPEYQEIWNRVSGSVPSVNEMIAMAQQLANYPGLEGISAPDAVGYINSISDHDEAIAVANMLLELLYAIDDLFDYADETFAPMLDVLDNKEETLALLEEGKLAIEQGEKALEQGEHEAVSTLANIWYNLGELDKKRLDLEETRDRLDDEAVSLSKQLLEADELKELENSHTSAKLLLKSVKEVEDMVENGGDLVESAEAYLESYKLETEKLYKGKMIVAALAITGGVLGLLGVPAAYEFIRKRFWLIAPVLLSIVLAAAAETLYYMLTAEMWYVGLFAAILALLHLLVVLPKEKKPEIKAET